jgi:hypothetical protein
MTATNSYQRAKLRVAELEKTNEALENGISLLKDQIDDLENYSQEMIFETIGLKKEISSQRNTTTAFVILSLLLTVGIIVLIATI